MISIKYWFGLLCVILLFFNCRSKIVYQDNAETIFNDKPAPGVVSVTSVGYGSTVELAETDAIQRAFKNILFQGVPSYTGLKDPMIYDRTEVEKIKPTLFSDFFATNEYERFIAGQSDVSVTGQYKRPRSFRVKKSLSINYEQLRKHFERNGAVKKFGY